MIVIGADAHKDVADLAAANADTGERRDNTRIACKPAGYEQALAWARGLDPERVWAIEDCRHVSSRLERFLVARGERVVRVAPHLTAKARTHMRQRGKSDPIDALAVARAALREGVDSLPCAYLDQRALEIRKLSDHRKHLVAERTRTANRLRWELLDLECPIDPPRSGLNRACWVNRIATWLKRRARTAQIDICRDHLATIRALNRRIGELELALAERVVAYRPELLELRGCGPLTAARIIGHTAGARRFKTDARYARAAGVAPIPVSSGRTNRLRLDRGGDRQLNYALHLLAVNAGRHDPTTKAYLDRKAAEGKTRLEALRCLKRHLARRVWNILVAAETTPTP